jgi:hypothetical protein
MLTGFPSVEAVKQALSPVLEGLPPAVEFLAKKDGPHAMIEAVRRALETYVGINWDLQIEWGPEHPLSFLSLVNLVQPDPGDELLVQRARELEDLFRRIFLHYREIRVDQLLWHKDCRFCVSVLAQSPRGATDLRVVVGGDRSCLTKELEIVRELAPDAPHLTSLEDNGETVHFGAIVYSLPEASLQTIQTLRTHWRTGAEASLGRTYDHLLTQVLTAWHQRGQEIELEHDLMTLYRRHSGLEGDAPSRRDVEHRLMALVRTSRLLGAVEVERAHDSIIFRFPNELPVSGPDPVELVYSPCQWHGTGVPCKISPGQLWPGAVLTDGQRRTWLTDFAHGGQAPKWWDFVCLEAMIRFDLAQATDLLGWLQLEECLLQPRSLSDRLSLKEVEGGLRLGAKLIERIRHQAGSDTGLDLWPYNAGLLAWAVGAMVQDRADPWHDSTEQMRGAHLLLATTMIGRWLNDARSVGEAEWVTAGSETSSEQDGLRLGEDEVTVWRGKLCVGSLSGYQLALFLCLYEKAGEVVPHSILIRKIYDEDYRPDDMYQRNRLTQLASHVHDRLRGGDQGVQYIIPVRNEGYRLERKGVRRPRR